MHSFQLMGHIPVRRLKIFVPSNEASTRIKHEKIARQTFKDAVGELLFLDYPLFRVFSLRDIDHEPSQNSGPPGRPNDADKVIDPYRFAGAREHAIFQFIAILLRRQFTTLLYS